MIFKFMLIMQWYAAVKTAVKSDISEPTLFDFSLNKNYCDIQ